MGKERKTLMVWGPLLWLHLEEEDTYVPDDEDIEFSGRCTIVGSVIMIAMFIVFMVLIFK
jgi:hypothetical protein